MGEDRRVYGRERRGPAGRCGPEEGQMDGSRYWENLNGRRLQRRALLRSGAIVTAGASMAWLAGCGSRGAGKTSTGAAPSGAPSAGQPQTGGVMAHWLNTDPQSLDVHSVTSYVAVWPEAPAYNQLLQYDPKDPDKKIIPDLA